MFPFRILPAFAYFLRPVTKHSIHVRNGMCASTVGQANWLGVINSVEGRTP
ncbi:hypothetical protein NXT3_PC01316 (plasmid) [Sinorhizobium fredii]|uniref:Uncharacterized protein n=1 Tax=Rhizobium fredii TaxID=380 RepID=A0A2L0HG43_RHIFR|nr:hypothetical protein NXT3_PC01316 [Sinorhizobium fredii]